MQHPWYLSDMMDSLARAARDHYPSWYWSYETPDPYKEKYTSLQTQIQQERKQHRLLLRYYRTVLIGLCGMVGMISTVIWLVWNQSNDTKS